MDVAVPWQPLQLLRGRSLETGSQICLFINICQISHTGPLRVIRNTCTAPSVSSIQAPVPSRLPLPPPHHPPVSPGGSTALHLLPNFLTTHPGWSSGRDCSAWISPWLMTTRSTSTPRSWPWSAQRSTSRSPKFRKVWGLFYFCRSSIRLQLAVFFSL